ncbi:MAG: 1,2-phenylacetyl-CoA epoxidase subunit PaaE [Acetobacteraceae bacterium]
MASFHPLTVTEIRHGTRDSVVVSLAVPEQFATEFRFTQGQYLTFRTSIDGTEVRRSYSITAAPHEGALRVGIKKAPGGVFSTWANEVLKPGEQIEAMAPAGRFFVPLESAERRHYAGFAAGSGITPIFSIIKTTLVAEPLSSFSLFYGNRASSTIMFREELEELKDEYLERLSLTHILSREQQDVELFNGRIGKEKCRQLFRYWLDVGTLDAVFICGPQSMMVEVAEVLEEHGLERRRLKFELFATADSGRARRTTGVKTTARAERCQVTVILDGRARSFEMEKNTITILEAALNEGIEAPYACKAGVCSTCRALLVEGQADMDANYALEDYETARGYILTCQAYPVSDKVVVDYDQ